MSSNLVLGNEKGTFRQWSGISLVTQILNCMNEKFRMT